MVAAEKFFEQLLLVFIFLFLLLGSLFYFAGEPDNFFYV